MQATCPAVKCKILIYLRYIIQKPILSVMKTTIDKQALINWIKDLDDPSVLATLQSIKNSTSNVDFWHDLPEETKQAINKAKTQLDEGEGIPHQEVMREVRQRFSQ